MKSIKTADLTGPALDWAVAKCGGVNDEAFRLYYEPTESTDYDSHGYPEFHYSTVWAQGGPIIEREGMHVDCLRQGKNPVWEAWPYASGTKDIQQGPTPLIAAMRCYVAAKLGDEVEVPDELV